MVKHIVSISSGLSSALAAVRVLDRFGPDAVELVFMDTLIEDQDNYRFLQEFSQYCQKDITRLQEGRTPYGVASDEHIIPNQKIAPCTHVLKIDEFKKYLSSLQAEQIWIYIGYDFTEMHRCEPTRKNYEGLGYFVDFPLLWKPYEFRRYEQVAREDWGIEPPRMYTLGYTHANCGGRCVKQGWGDWIRTLINFPDRYAESEAWEREMRKNPVNADFAILRNQAGKKVVPMTLQELREKYDQDQLPTLRKLDEKSGCVVCGIGG